MNLLEVIEHINQNAVDAAGQSAELSFHKLAHDPRQVLMQHGATRQFFDVRPPLRNHWVHDLDSLIELALLAAAQGKPSVWHSEGQVVLVWDDARRDEHARLPLTVSPAFVAAKRLGTERYDQKKFVWLLRHDLAGTGVETALLPAVRKIRFSRSAEGQGSVQHGEESLGRQVMSQVVGLEGQFPEECPLALHVYEELSGEGAVIDCLVDIDVEQQRFGLAPKPGRLAEVLRLAHERLGDVLREQLAEHAELSDVPVYFGKPS